MSDFIAAYLKNNNSYTLKVLRNDLSNSGHVDSLTEQLKGVVNDTIEDGQIKDFILDMSEVGTVCSRVLSLFLVLRKIIDDNQGKFTLVLKSNSFVVEIIKIANLTKLFNIEIV